MRGYTQPGTKCRRQQSRRCRRIRLLRQQQQHTARQYSRRVRSRNDANPMIWNRHQIAKSIQVCLAILIATGVLCNTYLVGPQWFFHRHVFFTRRKKLSRQLKCERRPGTCRPQSSWAWPVRRPQHRPPRPPLFQWSPTGCKARLQFRPDRVLQGAVLILPDRG